MPRGVGTSNVRISLLERGGATAVLALVLTVGPTALAAPPAAPAKVARATTPRPAPTSGDQHGTPILAAETDLLAGLPPYLPKAPVAGKLVLAGSSSMNQLAHLWAAGFHAIHPDATIDVKMFDSGEVLQHLAEGKADLGMMSRGLTDDETSTAHVVAIATAKDVLGVVVHPDNPLPCLNLAQGQALLRNPSDSSAKGAATWGDLGLTGAWQKTPIELFGRRSASGAWGYLVHRFLGPDAASRQQTECDSYAEICQKVAASRGGVGYVSLAMAPPESGKLVPIMTNAGEIVPAPQAGAQADPRYPLVRELSLVVPQTAGGQSSPLAQELLRYVLSRSGQEDVVKSGLIPLRRDEIHASRDQLGWTGVR